LAAEHSGLSSRKGYQSGDDSQQAGFAGPVGTFEGKDLPRAHVEVGTGQKRVTSGERNGGT
jgi:hypothetical protein